MNEKLIEFFKDPSAYIKHLLQECLDEKWFEGSDSSLNDICPFCHDADVRYSRKWPCLMCFCPLEICSRGDGDMVVTLSDKYGNSTKISELSEADLHWALSLFKARLENLDRD